MKVRTLTIALLLCTILAFALVVRAQSPVRGRASVGGVEPSGEEMTLLSAPAVVSLANEVPTTLDVLRGKK